MIAVLLAVSNSLLCLMVILLYVMVTATLGTISSVIFKALKYLRLLIL